MPKLGVFGVAIATVIARIIEFCICVLDYKRNRYISMRREKNTRLTRGYVKITGPIMLQGLIWGSAMATFSGIMGRMGADMVAAYSVAAVIQNIATVASFGIAEAGSILLGNELGGGELQKAKSDSKKMLFLTVSCGIIGCILMLLLEQPINLFLNFTPQAKYYFGIMYKILSINVVFASITYTSLNGIFTAGGDTRFPLYLDIIIMWGCCVLGGSIAAFIYQLSPICVFIILNLDELLKTPIVLARYKKDKWCINITKKEKRL